MGLGPSSGGRGRRSLSLSAPVRPCWRLRRALCHAGRCILPPDSSLSSGASSPSPLEPCWLWQSHAGKFLATADLFDSVCDHLLFRNKAKDSAPFPNGRWAPTTFQPQTSPFQMTTSMRPSVFGRSHCHPFARRGTAQRTVSWLRRFHSSHASHAPEIGPYSICMHRNDAATVSYTEVVVSRRITRMRYQSGSPCGPTTEFFDFLKTKF